MTFQLYGNIFKYIGTENKVVTVETKIIYNGQENFWAKPGNSTENIHGWKRIFS